MIDEQSSQKKRINRKALGVSLLMEQTARMIYDDKHPDALHPVQWSALRYFERAGTRTSTVTGLANFLGVTSAPASRTAASLIKRNLIISKPNPSDSRSKTYALTDEGKAALRNDPIRKFSSLMEGLNDHELSTLASALDKLYVGLLESSATAD